MNDSPSIIYPAPGLPAFLTGDETRLRLIVRLNGRELDADIKAWADGLSLEGDGERVGTTVISIKHVTPGEAGVEVSGAARLPNAGNERWAAIDIDLQRPAAPKPPRSVRTLSLMRDGKVLRHNAVAILVPSHNLRLAFASDIHIADLWRRLATAAERFAPHLHAAALFPHLMLKSFVSEANQLARRGELDLAVLGGDLVDHVYSWSRPDVEAGKRDNNLDLFLELLAPLEVPFVAIPGNHDYRLYAWRPRAYGLGSIGLHPDQSRQLLQAIEWWGRWPLQLSDFDALRTEAASENAPLEHHLAKLAPATDFSISVRGMRLVFANTGRDALVNWRGVESTRRSLLLRRFPDSWVDPDSEGLHDEQIVPLRQALSTASAAAVFMHAPLLHPRAYRANGPLDLHPGESDDHASDIRFEQRLLATGQRVGVVFRNPASILKSLAATPGPVTLISGHVHKATGFSIDRRSFRATIDSPAPPEDPRNTIKVLTSPSLSHWRRPGGEGPGYLLAAFRDGGLVELERRHLSGDAA